LLTLVALSAGANWLVAMALALIGVGAWWSRPEAKSPPINPAAATASVAPPVAVPAAAPPSPVWPALIEGLPDPAFVLDGRQHVIGANGASRRLLPIVFGRHVSHTTRAPDLLDAIATAARTAAPVTRQTRLLPTPDRPFTVWVTPLVPSDDPLAPAQFVIARDLTEQERLSRLRADFVANASHELRTPLTALKGFVETLAGPARDDPDARERFLGIMGEQADRMARLIDDLLSLSRVELNEHVPPSGQVDLTVLAADVLRSLAPLAEKAGITLVNLLPADAQIVPGDRDELAQVLQNLVQNAIKYGRPKGSVELSLQRSAGGIGLMVKDDGIGIAPEHLPRLTERFYRVSAKDSRDRGGTGLGLAIVKHIVARHRGELDIRSTLGTGSTFTVWLPEKL
jgi:two-component system phosphate regulon sensor histidine kinase PhoR